MIRALLTITPNHLASARAMAEVPPFNMSAKDAEQLFVPAGHAPGSDEVALCWAAGLFTEDQATALQQLSASLPWSTYSEYDLKTQPDFPLEKLAEMGLGPFSPQFPP